jgi:sulfide:quinone oxidoreductase
MTFSPRNIVIAGGGVGAVEALLALTDLSDGTFDITVVAPDDRFTLRALTVTEPFGRGLGSDVGSLAEIAEAHGATFRRASVDEVRPEDRAVLLSDGGELRYDALILSPGAVRRVAFPPALTFGIGDPQALGGLLADLEQGYGDAVAFVVPAGITWSLPLYELALMTAREVSGMGRDVRLIFATPEAAPLAIFGPEASKALDELLAEVGIEVHCGMPVSVTRGAIQLGADAAPVAVDRIVSLPLLEGPRLAGVPANAQGFIPVDSFSRVLGLDAVYAVGDATDLLVKQGGLACQQADVAARHIVAEAGGDLAAEPLQPVLRGRLLTGRGERFLRRELDKELGTVDEEALWWPPAKVSGAYLGPWLAEQHLAGSRKPSTAPPAGVDVEVPLHRDMRFGPRILLGLDSLGRTST